MSAQRDRPNLVYVFTDQQNASMMSCTGNPHLDTPAMDQLAANGVRFTRAYCTNPICSPSRMSMLTGRFPSAIGQRTNTVPAYDTLPEEITAPALGNLLREAGYETAYAGKRHLPADMTPESIGFEPLTADPRDECAEACADYIRADRDEPFLLVASFINPHDICYMAIREALQEASYYTDGPQNPIAEAVLDEALERPEGVDEATFFEEHAPPLPENHEPQQDEPECIMSNASGPRRYAREEWSEERWREFRWAYCRLTEFVDRQIGIILDALEESGKRADTVVVFSSDHGDLNGAHRLEQKAALYEEAVGVPFVVSDPDGHSDRVDDHLVSNGLDLVPTLCEYAGVEPPDHCAGRSCRPLVSGRTPDWRSRLRIETLYGEAIVTDRYKYALYDEGANRKQLYDLESDPGELCNHAADKEEVLQELHEELMQGSNLR